MAYTTPRTWTDGELVTAAMMNPHVRDNFLSMGPHLIARRTADQVVSASTTLVDDDTLQLTVAANEIWAIRVMVRAVHSTSGNLKCSWSFPTSGVMDSTLSGLDSGGTSYVSAQELTASDGATHTPALTTTPRLFPLEGLYINAGTAGTLKFRFAQNTANGTTTMKAQSTLWAMKLA